MADPFTVRPSTGLPPAWSRWASARPPAGWRPGTGGGQGRDRAAHVEGGEHALGLEIRNVAVLPAPSNVLAPEEKEQEQDYEDNPQHFRTSFSEPTTTRRSGRPVDESAGGRGYEAVPLSVGLTPLPVTREHALARGGSGQVLRRFMLSRVVPHHPRLEVEGRRRVLAVHGVSHLRAWRRA